MRPRPPGPGPEFHTCFICRRESVGLGVHGHGGKIRWICDMHDPAEARYVASLHPKRFSEIEDKALARTVESIGSDWPLTIARDEADDFLKWLIEEFGKAIRHECETLDPPF